jgi:hypothetical protein
MAKISFANKNTVSRILELGDKMGINILTFGRHLSAIEVAKMERNLETAERKQLNQEQIERFNKNTVKKVYGEGANSIVYGIGSKIYAHIDNNFLVLA